MRARRCRPVRRTGSSGSPARTSSPISCSGGAHDRHALSEEPAGDERQDLRRRLIEPLGVVDDADERLLLGDVGEQRQRREPDQEAVWRGALAQPEHRRQRAALGRRQPLEVIEHGRTELMQPAVGQLHLRLDTHRSGEAHSRGRGRRRSRAARSCRYRPRRAAPRPRSARRPRRPRAGRGPGTRRGARGDSSATPSHGARAARRRYTASRRVPGRRRPGTAPGARTAAKAHGDLVSTRGRNTGVTWPPPSST